MEPNSSWFQPVPPSRKRWMARSGSDLARGGK